MKAEKTRMLFEFINFEPCDKEPIKAEIDKELSELEAKAAKWDEIKTPKGVILGKTEGCWPYGDSGDYEVKTDLNCPLCETSVGQDNDGEYDIWFKCCPNCGQAIEPLSKDEIARIDELFEERETNG